MSAATPLFADDLTFIRRLIRDRSAIVLDESKDYLLEARLGPIAEKEGLGSLRELIAELRKAPSSSLSKRVVDAMTTNETSFYRDIAPFDCLKQKVLPEVMAARASSRKLDLWCGASSSGQEPYSILILLKDSFPELETWNLRLLATDLSSNMVERTREGQYTQLEVNRGMPAKLMVKYFDRKGMKWQVKPDVRKLLEAREMNLIDRWPPMGKMDIVFLRNVLIYFDVPTKAAILGKIKNILAPDGFLFLGGAETTIGVDDSFERIEFPNASCYRLRAG